MQDFISPTIHQCNILYFSFRSLLAPINVAATISGQQIVTSYLIINDPLSYKGLQGLGPIPDTGSTGATTIAAL